MTISKASRFAIIAIAIISSATLAVAGTLTLEGKNTHLPKTTDLDQIAIIISQVADFRLSNTAYSNDIMKHQMMRKMINNYKELDDDKKANQLHIYKQELNGQFAELCSLSC